MADVTIYDVADTAGVSISTVSLVLNHPARVKDATRQRVMDAIQGLGYVPKADAVNRARQGVGRIGVIAPFTSYASFAVRLNGVLHVAAREGFDVVVYDQKSAAEARLGSLPLTRRVDGLIVMSMPFSDGIAERLIDHAVPTVLVELGRPGFSSVTIDDAAGGRMVAELLLRQGHDRFAFLGEAQTYDFLSQSRMRLQGFSEVLPSEPQVRLIKGDSLDEAYTASLDLLADANRPTAVFAYDDVFAAGVLRAASKLGLRVPGELAVVGFDDMPLADALGLTTVRQPLEESGRVAAETLLTQLSDPDVSARNTTLALTLIERSTTDAAGARAQMDGTSQLTKTQRDVRTGPVHA